jgi:hypothetical protein
MYLHIKRIMSDLTQRLLLENKTLKEELQFMKQIFLHNDSLVMNMVILHKDGIPHWVDKQKIIYQPDKINEYDECSLTLELKEQINLKYSDRSY